MRTAVLVFALSLASTSAHAAPPDLPTLEAQLAEVTAHAQQLADALELARSHDGGLRDAVDDLAQAHDAALARLDARVREVYISAGPRELAGWTELTDPGEGVLLARGQDAGVRVAQQLVDAVSTRSGAAQALQAQADRFRQGLQAQAVAVLAEQDRARDLLAQAEAVARATEQARIVAARAALDAVSATVTSALAPLTDRGRQAGTAYGPVLALLAAAGSGYPQGYLPSGAVITGTASWYGPGFVGSPTAGGAPYDPEQPTCAHKTLPLGTVLHVRANGRSTNCLGTDRGPYVGDRVLDLSRAGSRALGYDGTAEVTAEVLQTSSPSR